MKLRLPRREMPASTVAAGAPLYSSAAAARERYDSLTPRTGAKAAQIASISSMMGAIEADEQDWTPVPTPRGRLDADGAPAKTAAAAVDVGGGSSAGTSASADAADGQPASAQRSAAAGESVDADPSTQRQKAKAKVRALQAEANVAAQSSVASGAEARRALQRGDLGEAGRLAAAAESKAAEARAKRRMAEQLHKNAGFSAETAKDNRQSLKLGDYAPELGRAMPTKAQPAASSADADTATHTNCEPQTDMDARSGAGASGGGDGRSRGGGLLGRLTSSRRRKGSTASSDEEMDDEAAAPGAPLDEKMQRL